MSEKKFELTDEKIDHFGRTLHRIRALRDIPTHDVSRGDLGGFVESEANLDQVGEAWVGDDAQVFGSAWVSDTARVSEPQHALTIGPIGSENVSITAFRTEKDVAIGHHVNVGCWNGQISELMAEVKRREKDMWHGADDATKGRWKAEYKAAVTLIEARIAGWVE